MKKKIKFSLVALVTICFMTNNKVHAQDQMRTLKNVSLGFQLQQIQNNFGFGLHVLGPSWGSFRIKAGYNLQWLIHNDKNARSLWSEYSNMNFGTRYQNLITDNINLYAEAGSQILLNNGDISSERVNFGGYGLFGFEFFISPPGGKVNPAYFIELGASGNNSRADKTDSNAKMANGFSAAVGFRF